jgi:chromosomal replication initiation ATPase DnaA
MTPRQKNLDAIDVIAQQYGYTVEDILGRSRLKRVVAVRRLCILMLRDRGYSTTEIGRLMDRDHTTIGHALNKPVDTCNELV